MNESRVDLLQRMPIFGAASAETLVFILDQTRDFVVPAGGYFFRQGDEALSIFVLETGRVEILREHGGREYALSELGPGDCFGEMSLIECRNRSASIRALEDCTAIELPLDTLHALYEHDLKQFVLIQMNIAREVSRRLRTADKMLFEAKVAAEDNASEYWWYLI
jgi:CRP-like cAMP-binding protein